MNGFILQAALRRDADGGQALEQLCRHITRSTLANKRVQFNCVGQAVPKLKALGTIAHGPDDVAARV
jgi:hypothetical protein